jgi:uncharacterized protein (TIGR02147 family)
MRIFDYRDYRLFLRDFLKTLPRRGHGEIHRLAQHLDIHPSLVSQILSGSKGLQLEQAQEVAQYFGWPPMESEYFMLLVQFERAGTSKLKNYFREKLDEHKKESARIMHRLAKDFQLNDGQRTIFYSSWLFSALRLYSSVGSGKSLQECVDAFQISRSRASQILHFLVDNNLCREEGGKYVMGPQFTSLQIGSPFFTKHHTNWRLRAIERCEQVSENDLLFTGPFSISKEDYNKIREKIMGLLQSVSTTVQNTQAVEIACLNIDLFKLL